MKGRCAWSGNLHEEVKEVTLTVPDRWGADPHDETFVVAPEHEEELRRYMGKVTRHARLFLILMVAATIAAVVLPLLGSVSGMAISIMVMGLVIIIFPFATPETVNMAGVRGSIRIARVAGVVVTGMGLLILILG